MGADKLSGEALCRAFMQDVRRSIFAIAKTQVDYLRHGAGTTAANHMGRYILALTSAHLDDDQLDALEATLRQVQEHSLASLFSLIDGTSQPLGFPDEIQLVNMDTEEVICPSGLEWALGMALAEWRARQKDENGGGT